MHFTTTITIAMLVCLEGASGFLHQPAKRRFNIQRALPQQLAKDWSEVQGNPDKQQMLKIQSRVKEMKDRHANEDSLSQEYCDSILGVCVAAEEWESVLNVLDVMRSQDLKQEQSTYRASLQACFEMGNGASASEILKAMDNAHVEPRPRDIGLVAAAMCRNNKQERGWWKQAFRLLLSRPSPEVPIDAYDAVLSCLVDERNWKEALKLLRELERGQMKKLYPLPALSTYREVIETCVVANQVEQATRILASMCEKKLKPTVYSFELVINALARKGAWRRCIQLLDIMDQSQRPKTVLTYNTIITACARAKEVGMAMNLLTRMRKEDIKPNVITYNSLISACANTGRFKDAMRVFDQINRDPHCVPDIYTYTNAIRACAKSRNIGRALSLYEVVKHKKLPLDSYFYAATIEACSKNRMWQKALDLLHEMEDEGVTPTDVIYSVTITACGNAGKWKKSLDLLDVMREKEMKINLYVYNSAITALAKAAKQSAKRHSKPKEQGEKLSRRAISLLDQMKRNGVPPDGWSYSSSISCCGAELEWELALDLMEEMRKGGPRTRPNAVAYTAAISACGRSGQADHSLRLFQEMKRSTFYPDKIAYNAVFSALRVANRPDAASELWDEICGKNFTASKASAMASSRTAPDIITLTDVIATLKADHNRVDEVFAEAVNRGVIFAESKVSLDSFWEVDLSSLSFPVARAACRHVLRRTVEAVQNGRQPVNDLAFITGAPRREGNLKTVSPKHGRSSSKREFLQEVLQEDFNPPIQSLVPRMARGTVEIDKAILQNWIQRQKTFTITPSEIETTS